MKKESTVESMKNVAKSNARNVLSRKSVSERKVSGGTIMMRASMTDDGAEGALA